MQSDPVGDLRKAYLYVLHFFHTHDPLLKAIHTDPLLEAFMLYFHQSLSLKDLLKELSAI